MKYFLFILFLINSAYAEEIKYECGQVGIFEASTPTEMLQLDISVDEKLYLYIYKMGGNKKNKLPFYYSRSWKSQYGILDAYKDTTRNSHEIMEFVFQKYKEYNYHRLYIYYNENLKASYVCFNEGERAKNENISK